MIRKRYYTIMLVPEKSLKVLKFKISNIFLYACAISAFFAFILSIFMLYNYFDVRYSLAELTTLKHENKIHKEQIMEFGEMIENIDDRMEGIYKSEEKLRGIAEIGNPILDKEMYGLGGLPSSGEKDSTGLGGRYDLNVREFEIEIERLKEKSKLQEESLIELLCFLDGQENLLACTPSIWPTRGFLISGFGFRRDPFTKKIRMHEGIDIVNKLGTPIYATANGVVIFAGIRSGYGKFVIIDHGYGFYSRYGHLSSIIVSEGDRVKRGDKIANMGSTGRSKSSHLHYEVQVNGVNVDPTHFILN